MSSKKTSNILITGATGFVGRHLLPLLVKKYTNKRLVCLVWNKKNKKEKEGLLLIKKLKISTLEGDLVTGDGLDKLPINPQLVIHLAANTETLNPDHRCNDIGTKNLIDSLNLNKHSHVIHISTLVLFAGRHDCSKPLTETSDPSPTNEYTRTKLLGEKYARQQSFKRKFRLTVIRPNTIYGPNMRDNSLIDVIKKLVKKDSLLARINWPGKSSLINVEDMTELIMKVIQKSPVPGKPAVYNADPEQLSLSEIAKGIYTAQDKTYRSITLPKIFWQLCAYSRRFIFPLEKILPTNIYNWLWRFSIIVDDVIYCRQEKIKTDIPDWRPHKFAEVTDQL
jgi:UDP-glucose 4-epimerase